MTPFSIVLPIKDEINLLPFSMNSAIDLHPDEIVFVVDANERGRRMAEAASQICRKRVYDGLKIVEVTRNPNWNFYQAWVRRVGYLSASHDVILTFDVDNVLKPAIMGGLDIIGKDGVAFVTYNKSFALKSDFFSAARRVMAPARERFHGGVKDIMRKQLGAVAATKTPFPGLYWLYRPFYLELVPEDEIRKIYNGEDTFVERKFGIQTKFRHVHVYQTGSFCIGRIENEELPWRQFEYGVWLGARNVKWFVPFFNTFLRVYPHVMRGYIAGRKMRPAARERLASMSYLEVTHLNTKDWINLK